MNNVTSLPKDRAKKAIEKAKADIEEENLDDGVKLLKEKYRELEKARTIVGNIERDIADIEERIIQGNI